MFEIADGEVRVFPGNYADYLWRKEGGPRKNADRLDDVLIGVPPAIPIPMPVRPDAPAKRINPIKLKQMQDQAQKLEERIAELEASIQQAKQSYRNLLAPMKQFDCLKNWSKIEMNWNQRMAQWEQVTQEIEATA